MEGVLELPVSCVEYVQATYLSAEENTVLEVCEAIENLLQLFFLLDDDSVGSEKSQRTGEQNEGRC
jgi:hypothetical protein